MAKICYDTSIFISYKSTRFPADFLMSAVVVQEMTTGASDRREVAVWRVFGDGHERAGSLLVPTGVEWWQTGKILNSLMRGERHKGSGKIPKLPPDEKNRLVRDILIAVTVKRAGALLVTENVKDFERIRRYCKVRIASGRKHFGYGPGEG